MNSSLEDILKTCYNLEKELVSKYVSEAARDKLSMTNGDFLRSMTRAGSISSHSLVDFSPLVVSTMTITGKLDSNGVVIPIALIRDALSVSDGNLVLGVPRESKNNKNNFKDKADAHRFMHQVSFKMGTKSCKLFYNGTVHSTGFSSLIEFVNMIIHISHFVEQVSGVRLRLNGFDINMLNVATTVQRGNFPLVFPASVVYSRASSMGFDVYFDPERHPAVKIIIYDEAKKKMSTVLIFGTGNITIFGSRHMSHVISMFETIASLFDGIGSLGTTTALRTTTIRKTFDVSHGYITSSYLLCYLLCKNRC